MDPVSLTLLGTSLIGSGFQFFNGQRQAKSLQEQQAEVLKTAQENASNALMVGQLQAERLRFKNRLLHGINVTKTAGSGIEMSGSAEAVVVQNDFQGMIDVNNTLYNAGLTARAYMIQGLNTASTLADKAFEAKMNSISAIFNIASSTVASYAMNKKMDLLSQTAMLNAAKQSSAAQANKSKIFDYMYGEGDSVLDGGGLNLYSDNSNQFTTVDELSR